jgi:hypothetical protein
MRWRASALHGIGDSPMKKLTAKLIISLTIRAEKGA